jgi:N-acetylglucosaminyldiphosphoundecaprenol N-acetyl-beta-D-mannosaminyltransferase
MSSDLRKASSAPPRSAYRLNRRPEERVQVLGGVMDLVKAAEVFHFVKTRLSQAKKTIVANHNLHSLYLMRRDARLRAFFDRADLTEVDSLPLILWSRLIAGRSRRFHRCTYLDWRDTFWDEAVRQGWRVFFVGGVDGVAGRARARILEQWPEVELAIHHGYFDPAQGSPENEALLLAIDRFSPHILLVGMGMPHQELWILDNFDRLPICAMFTVGAAFDYEAGVQTPCPRWIGQLGLEWLFRLCGDPRRLFARYCVEPCFLIGPALADIGRAIGRLWAHSRPR